MTSGETIGNSSQVSSFMFDWDLLDVVEETAANVPTRYDTPAEILFDHLAGREPVLSAYLAYHRHLCKNLVNSLPERSELWESSALYSVRLLLDADSKSVERALEVALFQGMPGKLDAQAHKLIFSVPPPLSEEWENCCGEVAIMPDNGRCELAALQHAAAVPMGLRPLGPDEFTESIDAPPGWACFHHCAKRLMMGDLANKRFFSQLGSTHSIVCAAQRSCEVEHDVACQRRVFLVYVYSTMQGETLLDKQGIRNLERVPGDLFDFVFVLRCFVRDVRSNDGGRRRTELVRELIDGLPICTSGTNRLTIMKASEPWHARDPIELLLKNYVWMLEDEGRIWAAANGFDVVEAWRGVRRAEPSIVASARHISAVYCLTPGEGALATCEHKGMFYCSADRTTTLSSQFPCREIHRNHCALPSQFDGLKQFAEGSVDIASFAGVIDRICRRARPETDIFRKFVDLGSGEGLAVIAVHQLFNFRTCIGIELVEELIDASRKRAIGLVDRSLKAHELFVQGDIFAEEPDWSDASVVFCNAATWPLDVIDKLWVFALQLRPGSVFILLNQGRLFPQCMLTMFDFRVEAVRVSWHAGPEKLWVFQRL